MTPINSSLEKLELLMPSDKAKHKIIAIRSCTKSSAIKLLNHDLNTQLELSDISDKNAKGEVKIKT